ncbi:MAG: thiamine-phosphate diphosphorylase [Acidobacteria bacterium RBG_16_68_9]|nr:MAG: thiamine-phosphate diphosphorylase [Acidobacteria bacterium RBG_16_68_9]
MTRSLKVYLITDRHQTRGRSLTETVEQAMQGGVRAAQLRERDLDTRSLFALACELREVTRRHAALLLINDRIDVALACGADGVHLPAESFSVADARSLLGTNRLIGISTHRPEEVAAAARAGADFAVFGPVFDTPSKRAYGPALGPDALAMAVGASTIPVLAIGGVTAERVPTVLARGASGVAVIRAILEVEDPCQAAHSLVAAVSR